MGKIGKGVLLSVSGFAAGVAFIVACGSSQTNKSGVGPANAAAQAGCSTYDVQIMNTSGVLSQVDTLPSGWIPFSYSSSGHVLAFRCTP